MAALRGYVAGAGASLFTDGAGVRAWDAGLHRPTLGGLGNAHHDRWPGHAGAGLDERCSVAEAAATAAILKQNPTNGGTGTAAAQVRVMGFLKPCRHAVRQQTRAGVSLVGANGAIRA